MKKGFTLIELLAVIVILAVIAIIAVPIIINIIDDARRNAAVRSADGYVRAVNYKVADLLLNNEEIADGNYTIGKNALPLTGNNLDGILGVYTISDNRVIWAGLCVNNYSVEYSSFGGSSFATEIDYCDYEEPFEFVEPEGILMHEVCSDDTKYASNTNFKIKTIEDLACFSQLTNNSKDFSSKNVYLVNDIDIEDTNSYTDSTVTTYGNINGDSTTSGLLVELTTGKGFKPIESFSGAFEGYAFTISNLMINRSDDNNVGLFNNLKGSIKGLKMRDSSVIGHSYVGTLVGIVSNYSTVKNVDITGSTVTGYQYVGGIAGNLANTGCGLTDFVFSGTVNANGYASGGVVGWNNNGGNPIKGIIYDTSVITTNDNVHSGKVSAGNGDPVVYVSSTTTKTASGTYGRDGTSYTYASIPLFDNAVDTIIGGDTDGDHYYLDFDDDGIITLYTTDRDPIREFKQSGTSESPYIISSVKDWKKASITMDPSEAHYYILTKDLDFTDQVFYPLGTTTNPFNGVFIGNNHTISNVTISGANHVGIFGNSTSASSVRDVRFNNITITATGDYAGIVANTSGVINGIIARNISVTGNNYVGTITGALSSPGAIKNIDATGSVSGYQNVGGLVGQIGNSGSSVTDFVFTGTVSGNGYASGGIAGWNTNGGNPIKGVLYNTTVTTTNDNAHSGKVSAGNGDPIVFVTNTTKTATGAYGRDGIAYTTPDMTLFEKAIDTVIGGDDDDDNYYFDLNSNGILTMYHKSENPLPTITGEGTEVSPYIIASTDDWRAASVTVDGDSHYYSLTSDLDFTNANFYALGVADRQFKGVFNGNHHTISNVTLTGYEKVGIFGECSNGSVIKDMTFNNISINSLHDYAGIVASITGTIDGIVARNLSVTGNSYIGGITGIIGAPGTIKNVEVKGNITGYQHVAGIAASVGNSGITVKDFVFKGNISSGGYSTGGAVGWSTNAGNPITGVIYSTTITSSTDNGWVGKAVGGGNVGGTQYVYNTTKNVAGSNGRDGTEISSLTLETVAPVIDTTDSTNSDGYSFTLTNGELELIYSN